jgi:hypothetical protein
MKNGLRCIVTAMMVALGSRCRAQEVSRAEMDAQLPAKIEAAVAAGDVKEIANLFHQQLWGAFHGNDDTRLEIALHYVDAKEPVTRFFARFIAGETLQSQQNYAGAIVFYKKMLDDVVVVDALLVKARSPLADVPETLFRYWIESLEATGDAEGARQVARDACLFFLKEHLWGYMEAKLYHQIALDPLEKDAKFQLEVCETYLDNRRRFPYKGVGEVEWVSQMSERREVLSRQIAGGKVPDFSKMTLIKGTDNANEMWRPSLAAAGGSIWVVWRSRQEAGPALRVNPAMGEALPIDGVPATQVAVAALGDSVFFGGNDGIYQVDLDGKAVRHLTKDGEGLPTDRIVDLCGAGKNLYFNYFVDSTHYGVAFWDTEKEKVTVIAPSDAPREVRVGATYSPCRLWWNAASGELVANTDGVGGNGGPSGWSYSGEQWRGGTALLALSRGDETLTLERPGGARGGRGIPPGGAIAVPAPQVLLRLTKSKEVTLTLSELSKMPEPAWDAKRIWMPLNTGLYAISRETGEMKWVAHQDQTPCLVAVEEKGVVYVATTRGLFRYVPE